MSNRGQGTSATPGLIDRLFPSGGGGLLADPLFMLGMKLLER